MNLPTVLCQCLIFCCGFVLALASGAGEAPQKHIKLPQGFEISVFAEDISDARSMALSPNGTLFIGTPEAGKVYAFPTQAAERSGRVITLTQGLSSPNGVAFRNSALYVAEVNRVLRFDNIKSHLSRQPKPVIVLSHGWKFIAFGPDGSLSVPVGAPCNICEADSNRYGVSTRMKPEGAGSRRQHLSHQLQTIVGV